MTIRNEQSRLPNESQKTVVKEKKRWGFGRSPQSGGSQVQLQEASADQSVRSEKTTSISEKSVSEKSASVVEEEQNSHALAVATATAAAAEAAVAAAQAAAEVVRLTGSGPHSSSYSSRLSEEVQAALKIQAVFRGYLARRAFRALKGLMRLQALIQGDTVSNQATATLRCMQSLVRVQTQVRESRNHKAEQQQQLKKQQHQQREEQNLERKNEEKRFHPTNSQRGNVTPKASLSDASNPERWDGSVHSADEGYVKFQLREAIAKREWALAYAYSHQLSKSGLIPESVLHASESGDGHRDWNWLEKRMSGRSWDDSSITTDIPDVSSLRSNEDSHPDSKHAHGSRRDWLSSSTLNQGSPVGPKNTKSHSHYNSPQVHQYIRPEIGAKAQIHSMHTPRLQDFSFVDIKEGDFRKTRSPALLATSMKGSSKHNTLNSSVNDEEIRSVPSYMASTRSTQAKSRSQSTAKQRSITPERDNVQSVNAKKRLSYPVTKSSAGNSGPLKAIRQQAPQRSPVLKGLSGPFHLYHSYHEGSIGSIAPSNVQIRRAFK
ncbi:hypothetical protein KP509_36G050800 [Ceratopteris richardii]|uniref:DUF4005 domain-containing protein n=1 Tax=Ceratopteris richardii TaxID=49495 RepID=A0A8T2QBJ9_CERRI|nr:hypothetical protein KP509_36G050800 [Ceratopteris richardii]